MKHIFYIFTLAIAALSLVACNNDNEKEEVKTYTIDFEDNLFDADVADIASTWSFVKEGYSWIEPHTSLYHETEFTYDYGYAMFGGGLILSSYNSNDPASFGTYEQDNKESNGKEEYSVAVFRRLGDFSGEKLQEVKAYANTFKEQIKVINHRLDDLEKAT